MRDRSTGTSSLDGAITWALRLGLLALVLAAPWPFGSVTPRPAALLSATLFALGGLYVALRLYFPRARAMPPAGAWLIAALALPVVQQLPLPSAWVDVAAPPVGTFYASVQDTLDVDSWYLSAEPFQTRRSILQLASFGVAFYLSSQLFRRGSDRRLVAYTLAALGVALALFGVYQKARFGTVLYGRYPVPSATPYGPFVNHNHFAGFVEACALVSLGAALGTARRNASLALLLGGSSGLMAISLVLSHSRGGLIAAGTGVVLLAALSRGEHSRSRRWIAGGAVAVALFLAAFAPASLSERLKTVGNPGADDSIRFRTSLWSDSLGIARDSPVLGTGLGTYAAVIPAYRTGTDETRAEFAESDWLQLLCEAGIVGVVLALGFLCAVGRRPLGALAGESSLRSRGTLLGALAATGALLVHGLYDFNLHIPSNALLFAILLGMLASSPAANGEPAGAPRRGFPFLATVIAAIVVSLAIVTLDIGESRRLTREIDPVLTDADEFTDAIQALVRSQRTVPGNPETAFLLGRLYNEEAYRAYEAARYRDVRLHQAATSFGDALRLAPARGRYWFELGWTEANRGNDAIADALFARAIELEPHRSSMRANYASYLASRGRIDEALTQLERGRELEPGLTPLDALNVIAPFVADDGAVMRRAAGEGPGADAALGQYSHETSLAR